MSSSSAKWSKIPTEHLPRSSHSVSVVNGKAYIFGGEIQPRQPVDNAMHVVDIATGGYTKVEAEGDAPAPRVGHTGVAIGTDIYVFGGRGGKDMKPLEDAGAVYVYSTTTQTWSKRLPASSSAYPVERSYHSSTATPTHVIIHGGCPPPPSGRLADVWAFDISTNVWARLPDAPGKGRGGTAIAVLGGKLWRFGGFDGVGEVGGGIDSLHLESAFAGQEGKEAEWSFTPYPAEAASEGTSAGPGARSVTALLPCGDSSLVAIMGEGKPSPTGGHDAAGNFYDDVWSFDTRSGKWVEVRSGGEAGPGARGWFGADAYEGGAVVWGGLNSGNEREGDGWVFTLGQ